MAAKKKQRKPLPRVNCDWLLAAYSRIVAGESELATLADYGYRYGPKPLAEFGAWVVKHRAQPCGYVVESPADGQPHIFVEEGRAASWGKPIRVHVTVREVGK